MQHEDAYRDKQNGMTYQKIADKYGVSVSTVKSWATRYWKVATKEKKVATKPKKVATKVGAPKGNRNAVGHGAPFKNQNATTHGLFAKYLPKETLEIVMDVQEASPLDILWGNIQIKFAAILRLQNLMYVESAADNISYRTTKTTTKVTGLGRETTAAAEDHVISAVEREEKFINVQARAMDTLTRMIRQYEELCRSPLATEEQRYRINKLKTEVEVMKLKDDVEDTTDISPYIDALNGRVEEAWADAETGNIKEDAEA